MPSEGERFQHYLPNDDIYQDLLQDILQSYYKSEDLSSPFTSSPLSFGVFIWTIDKIVVNYNGILYHFMLHFITIDFVYSKAFECPRLAVNQEQYLAPTSCHQYLSNVENKQYFSSVEKPLETLRSLSGKGPEESLSTSKEEILKMPLDKFGANNIFYVQLPDEEDFTLQEGEFYLDSP